jgi:hypothetical protein
LPVSETGGGVDYQVIAAAGAGAFGSEQAGGERSQRADHYPRPGVHTAAVHAKYREDVTGGGCRQRRKNAGGTIKHDCREPRN